MNFTHIKKALESKFPGCEIVDIGSHNNIPFTIWRSKDLYFGSCADVEILHTGAKHSLEEARARIIHYIHRHVVSA